MKCPNCGVEVSQRTSNQNRLYWMWLGIIEQDTGNSTKALHEFFKELLIPPVLEEVFGETQKIYKSTTDMSCKEFTTYLNYIQSFCSSEMGLTLPIPEELKFKGIELLIR